MGRLPAATGRRRRRGRARSPAVRRRRRQGARRGAHRLRRPLPGRPGRAGEQALRARARSPRPQRRPARRYPARPDAALSDDRRDRLRGPRAVGHPDQRRRVAPVRRPRPAARRRFFGSGPCRVAPAGRRGRGWAARVPAAVRARLLHAAGRGHRDLPRSRHRRREALRGGGRRGPVGGRVRARVPAPADCGPPRRRGRGCRGPPAAARAWGKSAPRR